jgi:hypothetical protein
MSADPVALISAAPGVPPRIAPCRRQPVARYLIGDGELVFYCPDCADREFADDAICA